MNADNTFPWKQITYVSSGDNTAQQSMFYAAPDDVPRPLLVALHTWSADLTQSCVNYGRRCVERGWHFMFPNFRGPNWNPEACGSELVVADIISAVEYAKKTVNVDPKRIYLAGGSGGGHCALQIAGKAPEIWAAISAWCPISDVAAWHDQCVAAGREYAKHIVSACGGNPATDEAARESARRRSPLTWLTHAAGKTILDISTGIHDGHTGSVPVSQAVNAYNLLAAPDDRISAADIEFMVKNQQVPPSLATNETDPAFGVYTVLLRRTSGHVRLTLFEGGHDLLPGPAVDFLSRQTLGADPDWTPGKRNEVNDIKNVLGK